jgi:hypothetical protein
MRNLNADLQMLVDTATDREHARILVEQVLTAAKSYDELYTLLKNPNADIETRRAVCDVVLRLLWLDRSQRQTPKRIDKRRAVPALLTAIDTDDFDLRRNGVDALGIMSARRAYDAIYELAFDSSTEAYVGGVRWEAITSLGNLGDKRALKPLMKLAQDKNAGQTERIAAILALESLNNQDAVPALMTILQDQSDVATIRGEAAERLASFYAPESIPVYIAALQDQSPDVRFWAAFGLYSITYSLDISTALPLLDHIVAFDDAVPQRWWHVGREALAPLGRLWYRMRDNSIGDEDHWSIASLISPLLEYYDFQRASWQREGEEYHWHPLEQSTTLRLDPAWLSNQLKQQWQDVRFNVIEPQPESLLLNWEINMPGGLLLGGLHRDGYSIMLTTTKGDDDVAAFAIWYRSIISPEHTLRLYEWADPGREILPDMTVAELWATAVD